MSDTVLILGGANLHVKLVEAAHRLGKKTIVVDNIINSPAKLISDYAFDIDVRDIEALDALCKSYYVKGIVSAFLDFCQPYYQQLCERTGCFCCGTKEQFEIMTNKRKFKDFCRKNKISVIQDYTYEDIIIDDNIKYPVYVKPVDGQGSKGHFKCESKEAVSKVLEGKKVEKYLIEEYQSGQEIIQLTYFVVDGKPLLIRTADQVNGYGIEGLDNIAVAGISPSRHSEKYLRFCDEKAKKMIAALGVKFGPVFIQAFVLENDFCMFDPGLRFPGTEASRLFKLITGIDLAEVMVEYAVQGTVPKVCHKLNDDIFFLNGDYIVNIFPFVKAGRIKGLPEKDEIISINGVGYVTYRHKTGDIVEETGDVNQRIAEINIMGNKNQIVRSIKEIYRKFKVIGHNGNNMLVEEVQDVIISYLGC